MISLTISCPFSWKHSDALYRYHAQATIAFGPREGLDSEAAVRRAMNSLKRQDYFLAVQSCMGSLGQNVRDPAAIQVRLLTS